MLGRLRMSVQEVMDFYRSFNEAVFRPLAPASNTLGLPPTSKDAVAKLNINKVTELVDLRGMGARLNKDRSRNFRLGEVLVTDMEEIERDKLVTRKSRSYEGPQFAHPENLERSVVEAVPDTIEHSMFFKPSLLETAGDNDPLHKPWSYGVNPFKQACKDFLRFGTPED